MNTHWTTSVLTGTRTLLLAALAIMALDHAPLHAQSTGPKAEFHYVVGIQELQDHPHEKGIYEAMVALDPWGEYRTDLDARQLDMRLGRSVTADEFSAYLAGLGFTVTDFHHLLVDKGLNAIKLAEMPPGYPAYRDTGDPRADDARYATEKTAWIAAHPAEYELLTAPHTGADR